MREDTEQKTLFAGHKDTGEREFQSLMVSCPSYQPHVKSARRAMSFQWILEGSFLCTKEWDDELL